ncbi:MAG: hypothetical protein QOI73_3049 [Solirubrobacteraceae bacterium]|nr:hypothetical protein [Solirubrobacteraceae bacterium]
MRTIKIAGCLAALTLMATPALATPGNVPDNQGTANATAQKAKTPGPDASATSKAKAYGKYCADQSKKHVEGTKGTPFSLCVTAMAKAANDKAISPKTACKTLSKKHVKGTKNTPFSKCVHAANELRKAQKTAADAS